jgi:hypothetical protein
MSSTKSFLFSRGKFNFQNLEVLVDASTYSEHCKLIKYDFKPGSVERSIDLYQRGYTSAAGRRYFQFPPPINIEQIFQWLFSNGYKNPQTIFQI